MKRFLFLVIPFIFLSCTQLEMDEFQDKSSITQIDKIDNHFNSLYEARHWVYINVDYKVNTPYQWQSPKQTESRKSGMCADATILLMAYALDMGYKNVSMLGIRENDGVLHALLKVDGIVYEPQVMITRTKPYTLIKEYSYKEAIDIVYYDYKNRSVIQYE